MIGLKTPYMLIASDLFADTASRCIGLIMIQRLVFSDSGSLTGLIAIQLLNLAPAICTGPLVGTLIDRTSPKRILLWVNAIRLMLTICLFFVTCPVVMLIIYLAGIIMANGFAIGFAAWIPMLLPVKRILAFNAKNETVALLGAAITPVFISGLLAEGEAISTLISASLLFLLSLLAVFYTAAAVPVCPRNYRPDAKPGQRLSNLLFRNVCKYISGYLYEYAILTMTIFTGMVVAMALTVLHKNMFSGDMVLWGFFMSSFQAGAASSSFMLSRISFNCTTNNIFLWGLFFIGSLMFLMSLSKDAWLIMLLMFLFGASSTLINLLIVSSIQCHTDGAHIGRAMSVLKAYQGVCMLIVVSFVSVTIYFFSPQFLFILGAAIVCTGTICISCVRRKIHRNHGKPGYRK